MFVCENSVLGHKIHYNGETGCGLRAPVFNKLFLHFSHVFHSINHNKSFGVTTQLLIQLINLGIEIFENITQVTFVKF